MSNKEFDEILETYIENFDNKNKHSETHDVKIGKMKYFIKVVGKAKKEHMKNEIASLKKDEILTDV